MHEDAMTLKDRWINTLYSDTYTQGRYVLRNNKGDMCCLGVLCDLADSSKWEPELGGGFIYDKLYETVPARWVKQMVDLSEDDVDILVKLNDSEGSTFEEIADYIQHCEAAGISISGGYFL
jgi:hypothetical protein